MSDGQRVVVRSHDGAFEPLTGQMVLDFDVQLAARRRGARAPALRRAAERARTAYELYVRASQLDEDPATMDEAERALPRALELDPWLAIAYTNLGNIRFRQHDRKAPRRSTEGRSRSIRAQPEAQYNLGYVMLERGRPEPASRSSSAPSKPTRTSPTPTSTSRWPTSRSANPEGATLLEELPRDRADGTWAEIAKRHL